MINPNLDNNVLIEQRERERERDAIIASLILMN